MDDHQLDIGVLDLLRHPGTRRDVHAVLDLAGAGISTATVTSDPVEVDAVVEAQGNQVIVTGQVAFQWAGECRRCLELTTARELAPIREVFEPEPVEGETWPLDGDRVRLGPVVREAVTLALPLAPLCRADCAGPDPEHYPAVPAPAGTAGSADDVPGDGGPARDPRWAALDQLHFDDS